MGIFRKEEKKVRETVELYVSGLVDKDIDMLMSLVTLDDDFLVINQNPYEKIIGAKKYFVKMKEFFRIVNSVDIGINWMFLSLADSMAWVNSEMIFSLQIGSRVVEEDRSLTFVLEKRRGDWYIVHIINSVSTSEEETVQDEEKVQEETEVYDFENKDINIELGEEESSEMKLDQETE